MATSGSTSVAFTKYDTLKFSWETISQSVANNNSVVSWKLELIAASGGRISSSIAKDYSITVNGTTYTGTNYIGIGNSETKTLASGSTTIAHNSDGTKTFSYSFTQEIAITFSGSYIANSSGNGIGTLNSIARYASITHAGNFTDESNALFYYSNPAGNAVTKLEVGIFTSTSPSTALADYREISKTNTYYAFRFTDAERTKLRNYCNTKTSATVYYYLKTTIGSNVSSVRLAKTVTIVNSAPTLSPTARDIGDISITLTGAPENKVIKNYNVMSVAANATALKGATIKSYKISCGGKSITTASGTLGYVDSGTFTFSVTDSRGLTTTHTLTKTLINYVKPTIILEVNKPTTAGVMTGKVTGNYFNGSFGAVANTCTLQYRIKENDDSYGDWVGLTPSFSGITYSANISVSGLSYQNKYTVQARIVDEIGNAISNEITTKTIPIFDWGEDSFMFNVPIHFPSGGKYTLYGTNSNGNTVSALQPSNENDNLVLGYGNYQNGIGDTNIYGGGINLTSKTDIVLKGDVSINGYSYGTNNVLWSGAQTMHASQTISLLKGVSLQPHGIVLVFSYYTEGAADDSHFCSFFVPKEYVATYSGKGMVFNMRRHMVFEPATKYLYISNTQIKGHAGNTNSDTANAAASVLWVNNTFVLRRVIGV